jgi:hypothetical protein
MGAHAVGIDHHEGAVEHVELTGLDVEHRQAFLDRDWTQRRQQVGHQK